MSPCVFIAWIPWVEFDPHATLCNAIKVNLIHQLETRRVEKQTVYGI